MIGVSHFFIPSSPKTDERGEKASPSLFNNIHTRTTDYRYRFGFGKYGIRYRVPIDDRYY